jgi:8-oxo-dGTP diphosphatase
VKRLLLRIWRILPDWMQNIASTIVRPRYQVAAGAVILNEQGQILLCEHTYRRTRPWGLPGGDLKLGETPDEAVRREIKEETGMSVQETKLLLIESLKYAHKINLTYLCSGVSGTFIPNEEVSRIQYFDIEAMPTFSHEQQVSIVNTLSVLKTESR